MSDPFHSSKYKLMWAKNHIRDLERRINEFYKSEPCGIVVETDPNTSEEVYKVKLIKPMPADLEGITGDAVDNLRSVLDQAGYAVSIGTRKKTAFPFADSEAQLQNVINRSCKDLPKEIVDLMRSFKPYKGGNDLLWALNKICNANKHTVIKPTAVAIGGVIINHLQFRGGLIIPAPIWDRAKNEMEFCRTKAGENVEVNLNFTHYIAIHDVEFVDGQPVLTVLNQFARIVESIVMAIEAEAHSLGLL